MVNIQEEISSRKVENKLYFDYRRFLGMFSVWLACAVFAFFPLVLRPMFTKVVTDADAGYLTMVFGNNDILYLVSAVSIIAVGMAILMGKRSSALVYMIAVLEVVAIFLAMMGYLMLEGDPVVFGEKVNTINVCYLLVSVILALALFITVNFRVREGADRR